MNLSKAGKVVRGGAALLMLAGSFLVTGVGRTHDAAAADIGMSRPVYGANQAVIAAVGILDYVRPCPDLGAPQPGVDDWLYSVADVYVVDSPPTGAQTLSDVSGAPNVILAQGGAFVDEVIGYTAPYGALGPGTYSIVIDECQDTQYDPTVDTVIPNAFRVTGEVVAPELPALLALKGQAQSRADLWTGVTLRYVTAVAVSQAMEIAGAATNFIDGLLFLINLSVTAGGPDPKEVAKNLAVSTTRHWKGIAADPPDYGYEQPVAPGPVTSPRPIDPSPLSRAFVELGAAAGVEDTQVAMLLAAIEKYQGAAANRDGLWARQHARSAQRSARALADVLQAQVDVLAAARSEVAARGASVDNAASSMATELATARAAGAGSDLRREASNMGVSLADVDAGIRELEGLQLQNYSSADLIASLDGLRTQTTSLAADLRAWADQLDGVIAALNADPLEGPEFVTAHAGGPYVGAVGTSITVDASASSGTGAGLGFAWDLDGDGAFDDASSPTAALLLQADTPPLVAVKVTGEHGLADVASAPVAVTDPNRSPVVSSATPPVSPVALVGGDDQTFSLVVADPDGDPVTTAWWIDGGEVGSGGSTTLATGPGDFGSHIVQALTSDPSGAALASTWWVRVAGADADGDGWSVPADCDDGVATINPGMVDVANGIDDDCDATTSDGTPTPVITVDAHHDPVGSAEPPPPGADGLEGAPMQVSGTIDASGAGTVSRQIDWGDGTTSTDAVTRYQFAANELHHTYVNDGVYTVKLCGRYATSPWGCALQQVTVANQGPKVNFVDLSSWEAVQDPVNRGQGPAQWEVSATRDSVLQTRNSDPSVFLSPVSFAGTEATVELSVETFSDDDFIGFVLGGAPDMYTNPDAHFLLIDWKQGTQGAAPAGLALSEVHGTGSDPWSHQGPSGGPGTWVELQRGATLGSVGWAENTVYRLRFRYTGDRFQLWVDDVLELDVTGDFPADARFGFYNYSQSDVRYRNFAQTLVSAPEGTVTPFYGSFIDPGVADTHTGLFDWADGSPPDRVDVISTVNGFGQVSASHRYLDDGSYPSELCITDDGGDSGCQQRTVEVHNVAPVVDAGRDRPAGPGLVLDDAVFSDVGVADTHTATVDWGDGSPVEPATVSEELGAGVVGAAHTYATDGVFTVEVCVTDDDGGVGCDTLQATVKALNGMLLSEGEPDTAVDEGDLVARQVAFEDENPSDAHTATIDWGDGLAGPMAVADGGSLGVASAGHRYGDNGSFAVQTRVCDDRGVCTTGRSVVVVANVDPTLTAGGLPSSAFGEVWTVDGTWSDAGRDDTHVVTIDWGDGTRSQVAPTVLAPGSGTYRATHRFSRAGDANVRVCVVDDDEGSACTTVLVRVGDPLPGSTTTTTTAPAMPATTVVTPTGPTPVTPVSVTATALPRTGSSWPARVPLGVACLAVGAGLVVLDRRMQRRMAAGRRRVS